MTRTEKGREQKKKISFLFGSALPLALKKLPHIAVSA